MLSRLRVSQRLSLLLVVPIVAAIVLGVPAVVDRVDQSRAAGAVVGSVADARVIAGLIDELQQERLLSVAYLASPSVQRSVLVAQHASTVGTVTQAHTAVAGPNADELRSRMALLADLDDDHAAVLARLAPPVGLFTAYSDAIAALIDALHLTNQPNADATGLRHTQALDTLLRANELSSQAHATMLVAAIDPSGAAQIAREARLLGDAIQDRFAESADPALATLLEQAVTGPSGERTDQLLADLIAQRPVRATVSEGLSLAQHDADLRRIVQSHAEAVIAEGASERAAGARTAATVMASVTTAGLLTILLLGFAVTRSVSRPLNRVTVAANAVADLAAREMVRTSRADETDDRRPQLAALNLRSADELGELASAFNRVQATAALLMEQQVATRRNVATMFGNIAHRTQSLVSRQLAQIDELERNERDEQRLASLYRLDHLTARLRRSADSLLVIAGARDDTRLAVPQLLSDVVRSAMAEIEGYQSVALGHIDRLMLPAAVVPDMILLLAELLENATSFSPPGVLVEVSSARSADGDCIVRVVDHGIGMVPQRLKEENQRLVAAERIDVAPTTVLGLFVVGRIARRHGLGVRLLPTPVSGITAEVSIPRSLHLAEQPEPGPAAIQAGPAEPRARGRDGMPVLGQPPVALPLSAGPASAPPRGTDADATSAANWGEPWRSQGPAPITAVNGSTLAPEDHGRGGLRRREPGRTLQVSGGLPAPRQAGAGTANPEAERAALDAFAEGTARAEAQTGESGRHGLRRRQPGTHLFPDVGRKTGLPAGRHRPPEERPSMPVDAEAERNQINGYLDGIARAEAPGRFHTDPWSR